MTASDSFFDFFKHSPDLYVVAEATSARIIQCNQTLLDRLGRRRDSVIDHSMLSVYHPECHEKVLQTFERFRIDGSVHNAELTLIDVDQNSIPVILDMSSVRDIDGAIVASRSVWRDITELHEAHQKLEQLNRDLESRVASRTRELENRNADLQRFAWLASHDLKTPLRGIRLVAR